MKVATTVYVLVQPDDKYAHVVNGKGKTVCRCRIDKARAQEREYPPGEDLPELCEASSIALHMDMKKLDIWVAGRKEVQPDA